MTSTSAALRASISAALSEAFRTKGRVDARALSSSLRRGSREQTLRGRRRRRSRCPPSPPPSWTRVSRRGRATRRGKIRDERESQPPRDDRRRWLQFWRAPPSWRKPVAHARLVAPSPRGELSSARERADSVAQARERASVTLPEHKRQLRRRLGVGPRAGPGAGPGAGPRAGPGAGPGAGPEARLLPSLRISATVYDVPRASFAVRSPSA